jgi:biotin transport system substrate-specific component
MMVKNNLLHLGKKEETMSVRTQTATISTWRTLAMSLLLTTGGALLLVLLAQVKLPLPFTPVPFTGSVLAVLLLGGLLGPRLAPAAVLQYLLLGVAGLPVFAGFMGLAVLPAFTGGYLIAFVPAAMLFGVMYHRFAARDYAWRLGGALLAGLATIPVIYLGGWAWLVSVLHYSPADAYAAGVLPFIPLDAGKAVLAATGLALWRRK